MTIPKIAAAVRRQESGAEDVRSAAELEALVPAAGGDHRPLHAWLHGADRSRG